MGKLIAIWGAPNSGKTTVAVKLCSVLNLHKDATVYSVFADDTTPALPVLFPRRKSEDFRSLGACLSKASITEEDIEASTVTSKDRPNLGLLGYLDGENCYSYARADEDKCREFLTLLKTMTDFVIVDCTSVLNALSVAALKEADTVIRIGSADLKSICFFSSQLPLLADPAYQCDKHIPVLNINSNGGYVPVDDSRHCFGDTPYTLPYCRDIAVQTMNGDLFSRARDKKYNLQIKAIASKVTE